MQLAMQIFEQWTGVIPAEEVFQRAVEQALGETWGGGLIRSCSRFHHALASPGPPSALLLLRMVEPKQRGSWCDPHARSQLCHAATAHGYRPSSRGQRLAGASARLTPAATPLARAGSPWPPPGPRWPDPRPDRSAQFL